MTLTDVKRLSSQRQAGTGKEGHAMHHILFVCHGNICRSPMAEFIMKDLVTKAGLAGQFSIASAAAEIKKTSLPFQKGRSSRIRMPAPGCRRTYQ